MTKMTTIALGALLGAALAGGVFWWQREHRVSSAPQREPAAASPVSVAAPPAPPSSAPSVQHPLPAVAAVSSAATPGLVDTLVDLFGRQSVASLFRTDDFAHRFVATIDNLGRSAAPASVWPMIPAKGRFETGDTGTGEVIQVDNGLRYVPYVLLFEQLDLKRAVQAYEQHYPTLQHEYEELGFPQRYFNDRFIDVLDLLIATPEAALPVHVHRPQINGEQPTRPWLLYEFDDPTLQSLSSGQRILLRMGPIDERRVKMRLKELRRLLAADSVGGGQ